MCDAARIDLDAALAQTRPAGIDVYFGGSSGSISDAVVRQLKVGITVALCGIVALQN